MLFRSTGVLSLAAIWVVKVLVPDSAEAALASRGKPAAEGGMFMDRELLRLNTGIFVLHFVLYAMFIIVPAMIVSAGLELSAHWKLYLPVVLASFLLMVPPILYADRRDKPKPVMIGCVALLAAVLAATLLATAAYAQTEFIKPPPNLRAEVTAPWP